ncbi:PREDICTED: inositol 1,4,5-trisphosphate receptor-interacting protein-like 1 [Corvus brachyrhynchos]|uniref:inositol 1,4,5-trisphosphate receptor-interacting protein-like 1 n=1 Tax=Corvus brachyrhynchos TaxID=85066 RepID=UPI000816364E|nr:PREDICTED: inositol 1,4,5-trisphosphate receptor-interacting protein-like 1 [Corvus brachyrhynchos]
MGSLAFWFLLLQSLVHYLRPVGDGLDEAMRLHVEARAMSQEVERILLEWEVEQLTLKQSRGAWKELLWSALQHWQIWAIAGLLLLLSAPWFFWRKRSRQAQISVEEEEEEEKEKEEEEDEEEGDQTWEYDLRWLLEERIQWPVQDLQTGCRRTTALMDNFITVLRRALNGTFLPVLQRAIGFGSAFEGWTAREEEVVYRVLVPMTPPQGHTFHLERDTEEQRPGRNFRVRVQLECSCPREQQGANLLCFLHHPEEVRRRSRQPNLLDTLCTGAYLDVRKTARWLCQLVRAKWWRLPQSRSWRLVLLPSKRSCKLRLTNDQGSFRVKVLFGVRKGTSDIFVSSRPQGAHTPSTMWPETYTVAETKFFRHMARQAPQDSSHLKCLQLLAGVLPRTQWHRRYFVLQLSDILEQLRLSLEEKHLVHFIVGNQRLPEEISLPPDVRMAEPHNLLHYLAQDPAAHSQAMEAYLDLRQCLARVLAYGHF